MGLQNEFGSGSHLGMGLSSGSRLGAVDIDFLAYKEGVFVPQLVGLDGDYNDDGKVDAADYVVFRKFFGMTSTLPNDPDAGTTIDQDQYNTWRENFGGSELGSGGGAVPEPTSATLMVLVISAASCWQFRRRVET
jgi:hypothetical protein